MALSDHLKMAILIDGQFQVTVQDVQVNGTSGNQVVNTLNGLAGKTPGSKMLTITGKWAVPINGLENDIITKVSQGTYHEIQVPAGGTTLVSSGWFDEFTLGGSSDQSTEFSATFKGELRDPE